MSAHPRRILVGYDGSPASLRALDAAADLAGYGSTLTVVTVHDGEHDMTELAEARAHLRARGLDAHYREPEGEAAEQLLATALALEADLVVVGRRNGGPFRRLLGTVTDTVVRSARCDVLVVG